MKRFLCLLLILATLVSFGGCAAEFNMKCRIGQFPATLDPQMASSEIELTIAQNTFEGLMRLDQNNSPVVGCAESYTVSSDGKQYTFKLRKNLKWSNGEKLDANDFHFGITRAIDPATGAPFGYLLASVSSVSVTNSDTLVISLSEKDDNLLYALTHPVAAPCNKKYFTECKGKYGITAKTIIGNGTYKTAYMLDKTTIRISKNANYTGKFKTRCNSVEFDFKPMNDIEYHDSISNNTWNVTFIDQNTDISKIKPGNFNTVKSYTSAYYLVLNSKSTGCRSLNIRKALMLSAGDFSSGELIKMSEWLPQDITVCGTPLSDLSGINKHLQITDFSTAKNLVFNHSSSAILDALQNTPFYCADSGDINSIAKSFAANWQKELGIYMNIETLSDDKLNSKILSGNFNLAIIKIESKDRSARSLYNSIYNLLGKPSGLSQINAELFGSNSTSASVSAINSYNALIGEQFLVMPIAMAPATYIYTKDFSNVSVNSNGAIDFSFISKK